MESNSGLSRDQQHGLVQILQRALSDESVLYTKTRKYHWNVRGPHFHHLHEFFEEQYDQLATIVDEVAERIRQLDELSIGTMAEFLQCARLKEQPGHNPDAMGMVRDLLNDHETIIRELRKDIDESDERLHDAGTADFLTGIMEQHDKMAWMLRATLEE
jgi:starvation-inducible DNA-binding protein